MSFVYCFIFLRGREKEWELLTGFDGKVLKTFIIKRIIYSNETHGLFVTKGEKMFHRNLGPLY